MRSVPRFSLCEEFQDLERPIGACTKCRFPGLFHCGACRREFRCFRPCGRRATGAKYVLGDRVKSLAELSGGGLSGNEEVSKLPGGSYEHTMNAASAAPAKKQEKDVSVTITGACWWQCAKLLMPRTVETVTFVFYRGLQCGRLLTSRNRWDTHAV